MERLLAFDGLEWITAGLTIAIIWAAVKFPLRPYRKDAERCEDE
jgi:hypothetical protein